MNIANDFMVVHALNLPVNTVVEMHSDTQFVNSDLVDRNDPLFVDVLALFLNDSRQTVRFAHIDSSDEWLIKQLQLAPQTLFVKLDGNAPDDCDLPQRWTSISQATNTAVLYTRRG